MEIKPVLVIEHCFNGLKLNESASSIKSDKIILEGTFTEFDVKNRNERIYTKDRFLPHLLDLQERMKTLGVYGEFDHPDVFDTALSRVSHILETITYKEEHNRVDGSIRLLNTHYGKEAQALILDGCPIFVSSRAAGVTESNGTVTVKKLFTYDAVADPGFASTKMNIRVLNESLGFFNESANFRIFDMSNESKMNELIEMNNNDEIITKNQMIEYTDYLKNEMGELKEKLEKNISLGSDPEKIIKLSEYYESLQENYSKMLKYLDYLAETIQFVVTENQELKDKTEKIIEHNDYLAENLEKSINYQEYIAENLDKSIDFQEYVAENVDNTIKYTEYIAENLDKSIDYQEYIAEHTEFNITNLETLSEYVDNSIKYSEYVAENVDSSIKYSEYLAEHLDNNIKYSEYIAENLDNNIQYSEYLAEHVDNNIVYSEYIAENLSDTQAYSKYIAESLDKTIDNINISIINESIETEDNRISDLKVTNVDNYYMDDEDDNTDFPPMNDQDLPNELNDIEEEEEDEDEIQEPLLSQDEPENAEIAAQMDNMEQIQSQEEPENAEIAAQMDKTEDNLDIIPGKTVTFLSDGEEKEGEVLSYNPQDGFAVIKINNDIQSQNVQDAQTQVQPIQNTQTQVQPVQNAQTQVQPIQNAQTQAQPIQNAQPVQDLEVQVHESMIIKVNKDKIFEQEKSIKDNITELIFEAKKRKAAENNTPHFLLFLNEENKTSWNKLSLDDKEKVNVAMTGSNYTSEREVLNIIRESLSATATKSEEDVLIDSIPNDLLDDWNGLNDTIKKSILASAKFYPNLIKSEAKMESFWNSRGLDKYISDPTKSLIKESASYIEDTKLPENQVDRYLSIFKNFR